MSTGIALFRGINVGGSHKLPMKDLVGALKSVGLKNVRTYIQSGNAVFDHPGRIPATLGKKITAVIKKRHRFEPDVLILSPKQLNNAIRNNPFPKATKDPKRLHLYFLAAAPRSPDRDGLSKARAASERFRLEGKVFYLWAPDGIGRSRLAAGVERHLGVPATARNWRTVQKLSEMAKGGSD